MMSNFLNTKAILIVPISALLSCCSTSDVRAGREEWSVYALVGGGSPSIAVSKNFMTYIDTNLIETPRVAVRGGDQGAPSEDCSSNQFRCFDLGGTLLVVPRGSAQYTWSFRGSQCSRVDDGVFWRVNCEQRGRIVSFVFDPVYGVRQISFLRSGSVYDHYSGEMLLGPQL